VLRLKRLFYHLFAFLIKAKPPFLLPYENLLVWTGDLLFLILDLILVPELYSVFLWLLRRPLRPLNDDELAIARPYFEDSIDYEKIKVYDGLSGYVTKWAHAFVSFNVINYRKKISKAILIHELVHIWQYQTFGSPYIFRALIAQASKEGYNYGGVEGLYMRMTNQTKFIDLNFEQQGEVFEDAYKLQFSFRGQNIPMYTVIYDYFIDQVRKPIP